MMSVICGIHRDGETWIGADSRTTFGGHILEPCKKWVFGDGVAVGFVGPSRMTYLLSLEGVPDGWEPDAAATWMQNAIVEDGWSARTPEGEPQEYQVSGLYANREGLWVLCCDFTAVKIPEGQFVADGTGEGYAYGAAFALSEREPQVIVRNALMAACKYHNTCGGDLLVMKL